MKCPALLFSIITYGYVVLKYYLERAALESEGVEVNVFEGQEICLKGPGGPTCQSQPILRM